VSPVEMLTIPVGADGFVAGSVTVIVQVVVYSSGTLEGLQLTLVVVPPTDRTNVVERVKPPPTPVTVMVYWPKGVDTDVDMTKLKVMGGVTVQVVVEPPHIEPPSNIAVAPAGSPLTLKVTDWAAPLTRLTVVVTGAEPP
jgi:hypothetical protein